MYADEQVEELRRQHRSVTADLQSLQLQCVSLGHQSNLPRVREYLVHGVGRRVSVFRNALRNVFRLFPPDIGRRLDTDELIDAQMFLHAFVINLSGVLDNVAWVYVLRHDLEQTIGDHRRIGLFDDRTTRFLPEPIRNYLNSADITNWYQRYLKNYRDALAHRIPLYIPPAILSNAEVARYGELEAEIAARLRAQQPDDLNELCREQDALGKPCLSFLHSFTVEECPLPVMLHPQMIADAMTVVGLGRTFFRHWEESGQPP